MRANPVSRFSLVLFLKYDFNLFSVENDLSDNAVDTGKVTNIEIKHHILIFGKKSTDTLLKVSIEDFGTSF